MSKLKRSSRFSLLIRTFLSATKDRTNISVDCEDSKFFRGRTGTKSGTHRGDNMTFYGRAMPADYSARDSTARWGLGSVRHEN